MIEMTLTKYIERKPQSEHYRIVGKGITVEFVSRLITDPEWPVDRICDEYGLTPAEVHAAGLFYYEHKDEIDEHVRLNDEAISALPDIRAHLERKRREREAKNSGE